MTSSHSLFAKIRHAIDAHKVISTIIIIILLAGGYYWYHSASTANAEPQYALSAARFGTLMQTVTGTGQVSASNQTDIQSQVSGTIESIDVSVGQSVTAGQLIATIDSTNAALTLKNARLSLAKLTEAPKSTDLSNAENSLGKSYSDAFNSASGIYLDLPAIMAGMKDLLYSQGGFLSDGQSSYLNTTARGYRDAAGREYDAAVNQYTSSLAEFKGLSRSSATSSIDQMLSDTQTTIQDVAKAVTDAQNTVTYISTSLPNYDPKGAATASTNVNGWATQSNSDLASLVSAVNGIESSANSLTNLTNGADMLDVEAAQLSVEQAQRAYDNYFIRAPYDGIIGRIPVNVYGQAGGSTVMATIIGQQKIASISLNEVDAAKVKSGQTVMITFDAIDNLNATGTVEQIDQVGTVTQGVVSYAVKILIDTTDPRIKPGMSVNTTIVTNREDNVLLVPSAAVKTQGNTSYVQVLDQSVVRSALSAAGGASASTTRQFGGTNRGSFASSTGQFGNLGSFASSTGSSTSGRGFSSTTGSGFGGSGVGRQTGLTISTVTLPTRVNVTIGDSDDTNTVILSGLNRGQFVVTRTITAGSAQTAAPSILSTLGGGRGPGGGGGAVRVGGGAAARPGN
jgi:HlyD family secretion protein